MKMQLMLYHMLTPNRKPLSPARPRASYNQRMLGIEFRHHKIRHWRFPSGIQTVRFQPYPIPRSIDSAVSDRQGDGRTAGSAA